MKLFIIELLITLLRQHSIGLCICCIHYVRGRQPVGYTLRKVALESD